ncbi:cysteine--tRNA ligase, partial [Crocinitomicaceae bacterium]|nr:cysteine--tRNA ligase [Crocinitomicaceae bacterium]
VANLFEAVKLINAVRDGNQSLTKLDLDILKSEMHAFVVDIVGLKPVVDSGNDKLSPVMDLVLDLRQQARTNKDWDTSDKIRDGLAAAGIVVKDSKEGTSWK